MAINVSEVVDNTKFNRYHLTIVILCGLMVLFDGFDLGSISFAAPEFIKLLKITRPMISPVFSAGLFGLTIGALLFGFIGDRLGIKKTFILCGVIYGIFTLLTATAITLPQLVMYRFLTGLGLGGASPLSIAIAASFVPKRIRTAVTMVMYISIAAGQIIGGYTFALLTRWGWHTIFYIGGIAPLILAPILLAFLPEVLEFLVMHGAKPEKIRAILSRLDPQLSLGNESTFLVSQENKKGFQIAQLFQEGRAALTTVLWITFFAALIAIYFYNSWLPTLLNGSGLSKTQIIAITTTIQFGGVIGTLAATPVVMKLGAFRTTSLGYLCAALAMIVLASGGYAFLFLFVCSMAVGFFLIGTQSVINAASATVYPTSMRSTAVGWAFGIGRIGGIISPFIAGLLLSMKWQPSQIFRVAAIPTFVACLGAITVARMLDKRAAATPAAARAQVSRS